MSPVARRWLSRDFRTTKPCAEPWGWRTGTGSACKFAPSSAAVRRRRPEVRAGKPCMDDLSLPMVASRDSGREGRVTVWVEYVRDSVKSGELLDQAAIRLRVQDDGRGLPPGVDVNHTD